VFIGRSLFMAAAAWRGMKGGLFGFPGPCERRSMARIRWRPSGFCSILSAAFCRAPRRTASRSLSVRVPGASARARWANDRLSSASYLSAAPVSRVTLTHLG
jgi:hypothetical protein